MRYRKKPVEVEAVQWTGKNLEEIKDFVGESLIYDIIDTAWKVEKGRPYVLMKIKTLEGDMIASEGDYIIKGISGEFYPCKPDIFKAIYEEVKELLGQTDKITIKIINKATQEIITEFNGDEYEILMEQEKVTEVSTNPKSCDNCGYGIIKANGSVQCYNSYTDFFSKQSHSPCAFWDKNKELAIKTVIEMRLCKNCKHLLIYNNDLCECECTNRTTVPLHSCQLWEGAI